MAEGHENRKASVLVVEDEKPLAEVVKIKMNNDGFNVVTAQTADEALQKLSEQNDIKIVWIDHYLLGKETGLDLVAKIKNHEEWKKIPIFVVSNTSSADKVQAYMHLGIDKYYVKANHRLDHIIDDINEILEEKDSNE